MACKKIQAYTEGFRREAVKRAKTMTALPPQLPKGWSNVDKYPRLLAVVF